MLKNVFIVLIGPGIQFCCVVSEDRNLIEGVEKEILLPGVVNGLSLNYF